MRSKNGQETHGEKCKTPVVVTTALSSYRITGNFLVIFVYIFVTLEQIYLISIIEMITFIVRKIHTFKNKHGF